MVGLSQVVTRRWMLGVDVSRMVENGYLTEPYKVVSLVDRTGIRRAHREATVDSQPRLMLRSSVYHLAHDVA